MNITKIADPRETPPIDVVVLEDIRTTGQRCPSDPLVEILITDINMPGMDGYELANL